MSTSSSSSERGRASTIVTSNRDTVEWLATFDDVLLAQSAVDRFKNAAYDLIVEGESYLFRVMEPVAADRPKAIMADARTCGTQLRRELSRTQEARLATE